MEAEQREPWKSKPAGWWAGSYGGDFDEQVVAVVVAGDAGTRVEAEEVVWVASSAEH